MHDAPILICYDGSDASRRAIDATAALLGPRHAVVVYVAPSLTLAESLTVTTTVTAGPTLEDLGGDPMDGHAKEGTELARRAGFTAQPRELVMTPAWEGILDVADDVDAALIVTGARSPKGIRERIGAGTSHGVAEHSRRPVLIVPPERQPR